MNKQTLTPGIFIWLVPVGIGFILVLGGGVWYRLTHPPIPAQIRAEAKALSVDPRKLYDARILDQKLFEKKLTPSEWQRYISYTNTCSALRNMVARHLSAAQGTPYEAQARRLLAQFLKDSDPSARAGALIALRNFHDPSWQRVARQDLSDPSPQVRSLASGLLQMEALHKAGENP